MIGLFIVFNFMVLIYDKLNAPTNDLSPSIDYICRMERKLHNIIVIVLSIICSCGFNAHAADNEIASHSLGFNLRPSYIIPTHGFYNGWNPTGKPLRTGGSAHINYSFSCSDESTFGQRYPGAYQGVGLGVQTFLAHEALGTPVSLYLFQGSPILKFSERLVLAYEWNLGLSAGWKPNEYMLTGSRLNVYINVGLFLKWKMNKNWEMAAGPEFTHYSNGDTTFPNGGANTINFRLGIQRNWGVVSECYKRPEIFSSSHSEKTFAERMTYDIASYGSWRADRMFADGKLHIINEAFPVACIQFNPLYHFNSCLSAGASLDLIYDRSANLIASVDEDEAFTYSYPVFIRQCSAGISARGEIKMPIFAVNIGIGYNFSFKDSDLKGIYGIFGLKAFMTDSLFLSVSYRLSSILYSHNMMFGIGWRFNHD